MKPSLFGNETMFWNSRWVDLKSLWNVCFPAVRGMGPHSHAPSTVSRWLAPLPPVPFADPERVEEAIEELRGHGLVVGPDGQPPPPAVSVRSQ